MMRRSTCLGLAHGADPDQFIDIGAIQPSLQQNLAAILSDIRRRT
jgi:hypothetical protein